MVLSPRYDPKMSRATGPNEYLLLVNLKGGASIRRFCEVRAKGDDIYIFQPRKGESVKVSYHESGQMHVKTGKGNPIVQPMFLDPPALIMTEEEPWVQGFENFADLLTYNGEVANDYFEVELPTNGCTSEIAFAGIAIGRKFDPKGWSMDGVDLVTLKQKVFSITHSKNGLSICVRLLRLH